MTAFLEWLGDESERGAEGKRWETNSELKTGGASGIGQRRHTTVVATGPTVEAHLRHASRTSPLGDGAADRLGGLLIAAKPDRIPQLGVAGARRRQGAARCVVDDLGVDVLVGATDGEPRPLGRSPDGPANAIAAPGALPKDGTSVFHGGACLP